MTSRRSSSQNSRSLTDKLNIKRVCCFCNLSEDNELEYGKFYQHSGIVTHYYCLLLSSNMEQKGNDDEGILGFLAVDIQKELRRGKRLVCSYCKKNGATLGCCNSKCKRIFHFPCGLKAGSLHQFFGEFRSYCINHRPKQKIDERVRKEVEQSNETLCYICYDEVQPFDTNGTLWAPCCKKNAWFHRKCVQQLAMSAGYFFKCPLCNNKKEFQDAMYEYGIFIPRQDASWELVPNAFEELLYRHDRCDAEICICPKGRMHTSNNAKWELILCRTCGSQGIHVACGNLKWANPVWDCKECRGILHNKATGRTVDTDDSSNSSAHGRRIQTSSSNTTTRGFDEDSEDSDISVGDESVPAIESKSNIPEILPVIKLRPGPKSFKMQQVEKLKCVILTQAQKNASSSTIINCASSSINISDMKINRPQGTNIEKITSGTPGKAQEIICLDSDEEPVQIVSESISKKLASTNRDETSIELVSGRKTLILEGNNIQMAGCSTESLKFTTVSTKGLSLEPVGNLPPSNILAESRDGTVCTSVSDTPNANFDLSLAADANGSDSSSFNFVISNVTSVPAEFFANVSDSTDCVSAFTSQSIEESSGGVVSMKNIIETPGNNTNSLSSMADSRFKRKADVVDLDDDEDDDIQIVQQTKRPNIEAYIGGASPSTSEETLPVQLIMESDFLLSSRLQSSLNESSISENKENLTLGQTDVVPTVTPNMAETVHNTIPSTVKGTENMASALVSTEEGNSSTSATVGSAEHGNDLSVTSSINQNTSTNEDRVSTITPEGNANTSSSASVTKTPELFSDFLQTQLPGTSTSCHGDAGTSPAVDAGRCHPVDQKRPQIRPDSKERLGAGSDVGDTAESQIFTSHANSTSSSARIPKSSDSSCDRTGLIESFVPLNELKFKLCGPDVVQVRCGSYILDIKMQNPVRARDACNIVETASSFAESIQASLSATSSSGLTSRTSSILRQVDESTNEKNPEPGPIRRRRFEYLDDMTLQEFPPTTSSTPKTPRSIRYALRRRRNNLKENMDPIISSSNETILDESGTQSPLSERVKIQTPRFSDNEIQSQDSNQTIRRSTRNSVRYFRSVVQQQQSQNSSDRLTDSPGVSTGNQLCKLPRHSNSSRNKHLKNFNVNDPNFDINSAENHGNDFKVSIDLKKIKHLINDSPNLFVKSNNNVYHKFSKYKREEEAIRQEDSSTKSRSVSSYPNMESSEWEMDGEVTESTKEQFTESSGVTDSEKSCDEKSVRRSKRQRVKHS